MFDELVKSVMQPARLLTVPPETLVNEAARLMAREKFGAVMVVEHERLVGIFTERDIAFRVVAPGLDAQTTRLADVMTHAPATVVPDRPLGCALLMMQEGGFRHLPVIQDGKVVGIVSSRGALDPSLEEFVTEEQRRKHFQEHGQARRKPSVRGGSK